MDNTLLYLKEALSNWMDENETAYRIHLKLETNDYANEGAFATVLDEHEKRYLNAMLAKEMHHAKEEDDLVRLGQLNEMYEQLY
ncbi:hypothetical protein GCM10011391_08880 [Pullulanibacillus camelliae]|uniref:Sporulation protein n=1 Tax=Pullulanibacillus camelliae TaxID=1707096 RepID=A0A8J2VJP9_9BACL|nr:sporulation protein [Pullulanibacillus camelliae]GGE32434.1 hypothetical protein GCM10011391_08880 [Pullulanibacillus camelliae]